MTSYSSGGFCCDFFRAEYNSNIYCRFSIRASQEAMVFMVDIFVWGPGGRCQRERERAYCVYYVMCNAVLFITNHRACGVPLLLRRTHFKGHSLCLKLLKWCERLTALGHLYFHTIEQVLYTFLL